MTPWEILGMDAEPADIRSVKRAYAILLRAHRPDKDPAGFQRINQARDALINQISTNDCGDYKPDVLQVGEQKSIPSESAIPSETVQPPVSTSWQEVELKDQITSPSESVDAGNATNSHERDTNISDDLSIEQLVELAISHSDPRLGEWISFQKNPNLIEPLAEIIQTRQAEFPPSIHCHLAILAARRLAFYRPQLATQLLDLIWPVCDNIQREAMTEIDVNITIGTTLEPLDDVLKARWIRFITKVKDRDPFSGDIEEIGMELSKDTLCEVIGNWEKEFAILADQILPIQPNLKKCFDLKKSRPESDREPGPPRSISLPQGEISIPKSEIPLPKSEIPIIRGIPQDEHSNQEYEKLPPISTFTPKPLAHTVNQNSRKKGIFWAVAALLVFVIFVFKVVKPFLDR